MTPLLSGWCEESDGVFPAAEDPIFESEITLPAMFLKGKRPNIMDVKAMSCEYKPIPQIIRESAKYLAHFHVNDPNLLGPGMGEIGYEPIIAALRAAGYDGWLSVEAFDVQYGAERIAKASVEYLQKVIA